MATTYMCKNNKFKKTIPYLFIILITSLCVFSMFGDGLKLFSGQDGTFHINRIIGLANAFEEHQILPKIYPYANNGFGYASPLFYCDIFLYPFAIMHHFGVGAVLCYKIAIIFYVLIGNIILYQIVNKITINNKISLLSVFLYSCCNYHLQNILIRSAFGEILAMTFLPLVVYAVYELLINKKDCWILLGCGFSLLVMSHLITTLLAGILFLIFIIVFIILNIKNKNSIKQMVVTTIKATILSLLLTAWYLMPMIEQLTNQTFWLSVNKQYNNIQSTTQNFIDIFMPLALTDVNNVKINNIMNAGLLLMIIPFMYIFTKKNKYINILVVISIILLMMIIGIIPIEILSVIQFSFRIYIILIPILLIICIYELKIIKSNKIMMSTIIVIATTNCLVTNVNIIKNELLLVGNNYSKQEINTVDSHNYRLDYNHDELGGAEYLPYTTGNMDYNNDTRAIKYLDHKDSKIDYIWDYDRYFTKIEFQCDNEESKRLIIPLSYYKGYKAYELIDNEYKEIELQVYDECKELLINSSKGHHQYMVVYNGTKIQKYSLIISFTTLVAIIVYLMKRKNSI